MGGNRGRRESVEWEKLLCGCGRHRQLLGHNSHPRRSTANVPASTETRTFRTLLQRLTRAGFSRDFVHAALLPDWWDDTCADDPTLVQDFEFRVARFLGTSLEAVSDPSIALAPLAYPAAQLRRVRDMSRNRLSAAIHVAIQVASATVRNLRDALPPQTLPQNGLAWRETIARPGSAMQLGEVLRDLWTRNIPVIPLDVSPAPSFQGMACIVEGRPAIVIGYKQDEPGRVAFLIAHEAAHIAAGDCAPGSPSLMKRTKSGTMPTSKVGQTPTPRASS